MPIPSDTRAWVGFEEVVVAPLEWPAPAGALRIVPQKLLSLDAATMAGLVCRFQFRATWVLAGVALTGGAPR